MLRNAATFLLTAALLLFACELYLRGSGIAAPMLSEFHPKLGLIPRANLELCRFKEGWFIGSTDANSRFHAPHANTPADDVYRIALVGDSYVSGLDVFTRNHFGTILEKTLNERTKRKVEVINWGRGNSSLPLSSFRYFESIKQHRADLVLYFVEARDYGEAGSHQSTAFTLDPETKQLTTKEDWRQTSSFRLVQLLDSIPVLRHHYRDSGWVALLKRVQDGVRAETLPHVLFGKIGIALTPPLDDHHDPSAPDGQVSELSKVLLRKVGAEPNVVLVIRNLPPTANLKKFIEEEGLPHYPLSDIFDGSTIRSHGRDAFWWKATQVRGGHWNHDGHRAVAKYLAGKIEERMAQE